MNDNRMTKNYSTDGGDTWVVGGKLEIQEGAEVTGLNTGGEGGTPYVLPEATGNTLGGIKVGNGLEIEDGVLSVQGGQVPGSYVLPAATEDTLGGIKVGSGLSIEDGVLTVLQPEKIPNQPATNTTDVARLAADFNALLEKLKAAGLMEADG